MKSFIVLLVVVTLAHISFAVPTGGRVEGNGKSKPEGDVLKRLEEKIDLLVCIIQNWDEEGHHEGQEQEHHEETDNAHENGEVRALTSVLRQLSYALGTRGNGDNKPKRCGNRGRKNEGKDDGNGENNNNNHNNEDQDSQTDNTEEKQDQQVKRSKIARLEDLRRALANLEF